MASVTYVNNEDSSRTCDTKVRDEMTRYWKVYRPSLESMMLSSDAQYLAENEQNEILSYIPPYKGLKVLELGAGIGRFTTRFAQLSAHVTAVDFMKSYTEENEKINGHFGNVSFLCADVTKLTFPNESFDLVFSNWLLMYLSDSEVETLMTEILRWIKPNGFFFFRESCYHQSGNVTRPENPTKYRTPLHYVQMLTSASALKAEYNLKFAKNVGTYIRVYGNPNQLVLLAKKVQRKSAELTSGSVVNFQEIRTSASSNHSGTGDIEPLWMVPGGEHMLKSLSSKLGLRTGQRVLSVGCGTGQIPIYLSQKSGAFVHGLDDSVINIHIAIEKQGKLELDTRKKIQFEFTTLDDSALPEESYEHILCLNPQFRLQYSMKLIKKAKEWLQPSGHLVILTLVWCANPGSSIQLNKNYYGTFQSIAEEIEASGMIIKETKSERVMALKFFKEMLSSTNGENREDIFFKIQHLENEKLDCVRIIALKSEERNTIKSDK